MSVSREIDRKMMSLVDLVFKWNDTINLVSKYSLDEIYGRHIDDSLQLLKYLDPEDKVVDVGSGAGLPGLALGIAGIKDITLVESDSRKCSFLRVAKKLSDDKIEIINERVEALEGINCDVITARGFAGLSKIFEYTSKLNCRKKYLLLKGKSIFEEIAEAEKDWLFKYQLHDSITDDEGKVIEIFEVTRRQ